MHKLLVNQLKMWGGFWWLGSWIRGTSAGRSPAAIDSRPFWLIKAVVRLQAGPVEHAEVWSQDSGAVWMLRVGKAPLAELHGRSLRVHAGNISAAAGTMFSREIYTMLYDSKNQEKTMGSQYGPGGSMGSMGSANAWCGSTSLDQLEKMTIQAIQPAQAWKRAYLTWVPVVQCIYLWSTCRNLSRNECSFCACNKCYYCAIWHLVGHPCNYRPSRISQQEKLYQSICAALGLRWAVELLQRPTPFWECAKLLRFQQNTPGVVYITNEAQLLRLPMFER